MQIQRVQNNNTRFNGLIQIQNLKLNSTPVTIKTDSDYDMSLAKITLKNIFNGNWANSGHKNIAGKVLAQYINILKSTLGIKINKAFKETEQVTLKNLDNGYNIKLDKDLEITHFRDDIYY